jgi:hypothetical protein
MQENMEAEDRLGEWKKLHMDVGRRSRVQPEPDRHDPFLFPANQLRGRS